MKAPKALHCLIVLSAVWIIGCGSNQATNTKSEGTSEPVKNPVETPVSAPDLKPVTSRKPNPGGRVFIVEYHHIAEGQGTMYRTPKQFRSDLERFYKLGFRPATVSEYLD